MVYQHSGKRALDLSLCTLMLVPTLVVIITAGVLILLFDQMSPIFTSERVGVDGKCFKLFKLRTMKPSAPLVATGDFDDAKNWVTPLGRLLRKFSIDELPQILNIINGQMSLVGYRPALETQEWLNFERARLGISQNRPGLTGLAQIKMRDLATDSDKIKYDLEYTGSMTLIGDLKILVDTIKVVCRGVAVKH